MPNNRFQQRLHHPHSSTNIEPSGDSLLPRHDSDGLIRIAYQNIHGTRTYGLRIPTEIEAMESLGIDIMGMSETNCPWTPQTKAEFESMMNQRFQTSRTTYSSAPPTSQSKFQPGGNLLTITGHTTGRITNYGSDAWGRFCWYRLRGRRDEGILLITAYRVCHKKSDNPGPFTAFQQQYTLMRQAGIQDPNPRQAILTDLATLIRTHRVDGYRPILMMDANGDYQSRNSPDSSLTNFLTNSHLIDPFYDKFRLSPGTFLYGSRRIDYIFTDPTLASSIRHIGYLGTHMGADSDHCMAYMDIDETHMFQGIINRPLPHHSREIQIAQADKVKAFIDALETKLDDHRLPQRVADLANEFAINTATPATIVKYNKLYGEFLDLARAMAKTVGRKKYGYNRSPTLTSAGQMLLLYKHVYCCKTRNAPFSSSILHRCKKYDVSIDSLLDMSIPELRNEIRRLRMEHWDTKKHSENLRSEWLKSVAQDRARTLDDPDWEKKLSDMRRTVKTNAINRKLTAIVKGPRGVLDRIQIPTHDWFFSPKLNELYHYDSGVFEAYPAFDDTTFHTYHTIKILPDDVQLVDVECIPPHNRWTILRTLPHATTFWRDIESQDELEAHLLDHNRRHLEQTSREGGISTRSPLTLVRQNYGINPLTEQILDGSFTTSYDLSPEMAAFFDALKSTPATTSLPPVLGAINSAQFQKMFQLSKEKTSSDIRTLNYSLWKCIATSDRISQYAAILVSLPFMYGFVNTHWTHMSDFMLEKKPGLRQIHQLRIIGKVPAEFNTCLKFYIGHQTMHNFENADPCDDQHGFRPNRSSIDAGLLKLLTFECARMQRSTMCMVQHDMTAHFDRMYPAMTSIYASRYNVDRNILLSIGKTIHWLKRNVETALGISTASYKQLPNAPEIGGMVQGKADVPQLSTQQSDAMLKAHKTLTTGLSLPNPNGSRIITHHSVSFADDTDNPTNKDTSGPNPILQAVKTCEKSAQIWSNLVNICGGLIALHKCNWQIIAWDGSSGHMELLKDPNTVLILRNGNGTPTIIDYFPPDKPNVGLGFLLCPDGSQTPQFQNLKTAINTLCGRIESSFLNESETRQALTQRLLPKLKYVLHTTTLNRLQCNRINSIICSTFLPRMRLNRHFPRAVLYAPIKYGGMAFPEVGAIQLSTQLEYFIKQLRWNRIMANTLLVTIDTIQLHTGVGPPLLESVSPPIQYAGPSLILSIRDRLRQIDASLWIEDVWQHPLQRENDEFIMDRFLQIPGISRSELRQANAVRLYLRVLTIADLAAPNGREIPDGNMSGEWQGGSDIYWPYQVKPPKKFWATFRRCMRHTFCKSTPHTQPAHYGMTLDTHLGQWLPVRRHSWFDVYRSPTCLYWRIESTIYKLKSTNVPGFYMRDCTITLLPLDCHPIGFRNMGDRIWTHRRYTMSPPPETHTPPIGITLCNTIKTTTEPLKIGCNASLHPSQHIATCAWVIETPSEDQVQAYCHIHNISSFTTYRSELEGIYRSLLHVRTLGLLPPHIQQWCDNKAAIDNAASYMYTPSRMNRPDTDILLALQKLRAEFQPGTLRQTHVYGHQDTRTRPSQPPPSPSTASLPSWDVSSSSDESQPASFRAAAARLNILCDELATEAATSVKQGSYPDISTITPPYPGAKALLRVGKMWITSHVSRHVTAAYHTHNIREYCRAKYHWSDTTFDTVYWDGIERARTRGTKTQLMQSSKILHGWLPVMHMVGHATHLTQCPGCPCTDETFDHLFHCTHPKMRAILIDRMQALEKYMTKARLPRAFSQPFNTFLQAYLDGNDPPDIEAPLAQEAFQSQTDIGQDLLIRGFLSKEWLHLLAHTGHNRPDNVLTNIIRFLWNDLIRPIWDTRNQILHRSTNLATSTLASRLDERLQWFLNNKLTALSRADQFLVHYSSTDIPTMTTPSKRERVRHLEVAQNAWEIEQLQRQQGQTVLTSFFTRDTNPHREDAVAQPLHPLSHNPGDKVASPILSLGVQS